MSLRKWVSRIAAGQPSKRGRDRKVKPRPFRLILETLEDRLMPTTTLSVGPTTADLIAKIDQADHTQGPVVLNLPSGNVYKLTAPVSTSVPPDKTLIDNTFATLENYDWYGPNGLPAIDNDITINGNGSVIERGDLWGGPPVPAFRLFYVSGGNSGLSLGKLTLYDLTLVGGFAKGGDGGPGGGGGLGAGGAIFNQGTLTLNAVTLAFNQAVGGNGGFADYNPGGYLGVSGGGGGGMGSDADSLGTGGGFGLFPSGIFGGLGGQGSIGFNNPDDDHAGAGGGGGGFRPDDNGNSGGPGVGGGLGSFGGSVSDRVLTIAAGDGGAGGLSFDAGGAGGNFGFGGTALTFEGGGGGGVGGGGAAGDVKEVALKGFPGFFGNETYYPGYFADYGGGGGFGGGGGAYGGNGGFGGGGCGRAGLSDTGSFGGGAGGAGFVVTADPTTLFGNPAYVFDYFGAGGGGAGMGGAIFNMGDVGILQGCGVLSMTDCTLAYNIAQGGNGGFGGNDGATGGEGGSGFGGAIFNLDGLAGLADSTVDDNTVVAGRGGVSGGDTWAHAKSGSIDGGAVYNLAFGNFISTGSPTGAELSLFNSILADSISGSDLAANVKNGNGTNHAEVVGSTNLVESQNIMGSATLAPSVIIKKLQGVSPNLGPLQYNGGFTPTMAIVSKSSAAFSNGNPSYAVNVPNDQRGFERVVNGRLDLGAYEVQTDELNKLHPHRVHSSTFPETSLVEPLSGAVGQAYGQPLTVRLTRHGEPLAGVLVTFTVHPGPTGAGGMLSAPGVKPATTLTVATDSDGEASVAVMANAVAGPFTVTAAARPDGTPPEPLLPVQAFYLDNEAGRESSHQLGTWFLPTWAERMSWRDIDDPLWAAASHDLGFFFPFFKGLLTYPSQEVVGRDDSSVVQTQRQTIPGSVGRWVGV
jgi:hypothetical protein